MPPLQLAQSVDSALFFHSVLQLLFVGVLRLRHIEIIAQNIKARKKAKKETHCKKTGRVGSERQGNWLCGWYNYSIPQRTRVSELSLDRRRRELREIREGGNRGCKLGCKLAPHIAICRLIAPCRQVVPKHIAVADRTPVRNDLVCIKDPKVSVPSVGFASWARLAQVVPAHTSTI